MKFTPLLTVFISSNGLCAILKFYVIYRKVILQIELQF